MTRTEAVAASRLVARMAQLDADAELAAWEAIAALEEREGRSA